ncbi:MAG: hypothetical protein QS721_07300 [Candidatus Endonucleobacter sp. (ex Gigantidas childressi)]|nr:hypothetical protein [Candidatus Endonucleobacter sp. (ex Gigantidas childressi)]
MLIKFKQNVSEKYCFAFLFIALISIVTIDNDKLVINIYRLLICLPILTLSRWSDVVCFAKQPFVKRYLLLTIFCLFSLLWSEPGHIKNMFFKILTMTVFLYLIYLVFIYQPSYFRKLDSIYIFLSMTLLSLFILHNLGKDITTEDVYGVFGNKNEIAWFFSISCLIIGHKLIFEKFDIYLLAVFLISLSTVWVLASRASILAVLFGLFFSLIMVPNRSIVKRLGLLGLGCLLIALYISNNNMASSLIERGDSFRFEIYNNAFNKIAESAMTILLGHGIATDSESLGGYNITFGHWHSIYVSMLYYCGLTGLMLMLYCFFYRFWLLYRKKTIICVWDVVVFAMAIALLFDGNRIYSYPGGVFMSFVLPVFFANISSDIPVTIEAESKRQTIEPQ